MCLPAAIDEDDDETLKRAIAMSLQEDPTDNQGGRQRGGDVGKGDGHVLGGASKEQRGGDPLHQRNRIRFNLIPQ